MLTSWRFIFAKANITSKNVEDRLFQAGTSEDGVEICGTRRNQCACEHLAWRSIEYGRHQRVQQKCKEK